MIVPISLAVQYRWLIRLGLIGYALTTIIGWAIQGPYYSTAYVAKAHRGRADLPRSRSTSCGPTATRSRSSSARSRPRLAKISRRPAEGATAA